MLIVPAIDLRGGRCVRLVQGDYDRETVFGDDPARMARRWIEEGARALHLVDLDGALSGRSDNFASVEAVLAEIEAMRKNGAVAGEIQTDLGGGIRDMDGIEHWLGAGLHHVILGTAAVNEPELVSEAAKNFPSRVWVGIDARAGKVAVRGWKDVTDVNALDLARDVEARGAGGIVYTDIERDGTGDGVNIEATRDLASAVSIPVYASGGVHTAEDVKRLADVASSGIRGVIVGRALYAADVTLAELLEALASES